VFRNGFVEVSNAKTLATREMPGVGPVNQIHQPHFDEIIIGTVDSILSCQQQLGLAPPTGVMLSLLRARGCRIWYTHYQEWSGDPIERDEIICPELVIEQRPGDQKALARLLKPMLDTVWNACGHPRSWNFNPAGEWTGGT